MALRKVSQYPRLGRSRLVPSGMGQNRISSGAGFCFRSAQHEGSDCFSEMSILRQGQDYSAWSRPENIFSIGTYNPWSIDRASLLRRATLVGGVYPSPFKKTASDKIIRQRSPSRLGLGMPKLTGQSERQGQL